MRKIINLFFVGFVGLAAFAAPTVTDVVAKQRYPWGLVDITCRVTGIQGQAKGLEFSAVAIMPDTGNTNGLTSFWIMKDGMKLTDFSVSANGSYHLLWDAKADLGEVRYTNMIVNLSIKDTIKVQLWEGGPYWATMNIGAEKPEDYGYFFWWGDTVGYEQKIYRWVSSDGLNPNFSFDESGAPTYDFKDVLTLQREGWITVDKVLAPKHDASQVHWGGDWRMPTKQEFDDLDSKCDWTWGSLNGVNGYVVRGRDSYASNSIFLPCAGYGYGTSLYDAGSNGGYWSSVPNSNYTDAWALNFNSRYYITKSDERCFGRTIRPVQGFNR